MDGTDVIIVGAGPVGLLLSTELVLSGASVQVLERLAAPDRTIKAGSINIASAELLARRGLLPELRAADERTRERFNEFYKSVGREWLRGMPARRQRGHFAGFMFDDNLIDDNDSELVDHDAATNAIMIPQADIERILNDYAARLGIEVTRGVTVTGLDSECEGSVTVHTDAGDFSAKWVVGCDGGRSVVRRAAGFGFPGTGPEITGRQAIVTIADPEKLEPGWTWTSNGVYCHGPLPGRVLTAEFDGPPVDRELPVTALEVQESLRRVSGTDVTFEALVGDATRWTDNARQASTYRNGSVLLAGDAAHVHSPFSGQGLNLGIGDALNLGWKLGGIVTGRYPAELLDTYTTERHPIGASVLAWTRAQVALLRGDAKTADLRTVIADLLGTRDGMTYIYKRATGLQLRYDLPGEHPMIGRLAPNVTLSDGTYLHDYGRSGGFVVLDRRSGSTSTTTSVTTADNVTTIVDPCTADPRLMVIRPDGIVGWAEGD